MSNSFSILLDILTLGQSGGAEQFCAPKLGGGPTYMDLDYYKVFSEAGYSIVDDNTTLAAASNSDRLLGIFSISNMAKCKNYNRLLSGSWH